MHTYDIIVLIVLASATLFGAIKGFAWQVASLASIVVSLVVANYFRNDVAQMINAQPPWNMFLAMLLLYFGSSLAIWMLFRLISTSIDKIKLKEFDRQLGAGFGLIKGAVLCCVITMFAMTLLGPSQQQAIASSRSGYYIGRVLSQADAILPKEVAEVIGPYIDRVNHQLEQGRDPNFQVDPNSPALNPNLDAWGRAIESRMSEIGNEWNQNQGVPSDANRPSGGVLSRLFPSSANGAGGQPGAVPQNNAPQGWPVSSPALNPNAPFPGTSPPPNQGTELFPPGR